MKQIIITLGFLLGMALSVLAQKSEIPAFSFKGLEGTTFTQEQLKPNLATIFFYFDPWCDHCATQADWIRASADRFKNIQLVFVTTEPELEATVEFKKKHFEGAALAHLTFALDTEYMFDGYFNGYYEVPSILLYSAEGKRIKVLSEETPVDKLLSYFQ